jgi:hypothetical protein
MHRRESKSNSYRPPFRATLAAAFDKCDRDGETRFTKSPWSIMAIFIFSMS